MANCGSQEGTAFPACLNSIQMSKKHLEIGRSGVWYIISFQEGSRSKLYVKFKQSVRLVQRPGLLISE